MRIKILILLTLLAVSTTDAATITSISLHDKSGSNVENYPLTFGIVLKQGDATGNVYLNNGSDIPTQTNVKRTWPDGSIRHCVISAIIPTITANGSTTININTTGTGAATTPISKTAMLATDIGATIDLSSLSGSGHSGALQADLRTVLTSATLDYWLSGSVCSEVILKQTLSNSLDVEWEVRFYSTGDIRISHVINNVNANYRGNVSYDININQGNSVPTSVYTHVGFSHSAMTRWRKVFWLENEPKDVELKYDIEYLISTKHIPNYDTSLNIPETTISNYYSEWIANNRDIDGMGMREYYNFATGEEASPLMRWDIAYLMTGDSRLREIVLNDSQIMGNIPCHWREDNVSYSFYGRPVSLIDRPTCRTRDDTGFASDVDITSSPWVYDMAHQWPYNYLPYLITGDKFYADELCYWTGYNLTYSNPGYRYNGLGIIPVNEQIRGVAWAYRTLCQAASIIPDDWIEKEYYETIIENNIEFYTAYVNKPPLYALGDNNPACLQGLVDDAVAGTTPYMHDYLICGFGVGDDLGYDAGAIFVNYSKFLINRFTNPDFNPYNGAPYHFPTATAEGPVTSWAQASSLFDDQPTSFAPIGYAYSYRHKALAALSYVIGYGASTAYSWLLENITPGTPDLKTQYEIYPTWAILPRVASVGYDPPTITGPDDFSTTASSVEIVGTYTVDSELTVDTVTWTLGESSGFCVAALGIFSCTVPVELGANSVVFEITDSNSETASDTTIVTRTVVPQASITNTSISHGVLRH